MHHEAYRVMSNGDHKRQVFLSHSHTNNVVFFLAPHIIPHFILEKHEKRLPENPEFALSLK